MYFQCSTFDRTFVPVWMAPFRRVGGGLCISERDTEAGAGPTASDFY